MIFFLHCRETVCLFSLHQHASATFFSILLCPVVEEIIFFFFFFFQLSTCVCLVTAILLQRQHLCTGNGHALKSLTRKHNGNQFSHPDFKITADKFVCRTPLPYEEICVLPTCEV